MGKAWWIQDADKNYPQFNDTVDYVLKCYEEKGPFDGILGFSQGAGLGLFLAALQEKGDIATDFKFVISYSGFYPSDISLQVESLYLHKYRKQWIPGWLAFLHCILSGKKMIV